jgi:hypothetical protein
MIGHNQPSFDDIVQESLARGLLLTIKDAYTTLSRDPRAEKRHFRVLAEIIDRLNYHEIDAKGMSFPGRKYLARQSADAMRPDGYSEATIAKTIVELLAWGYLAHDRRAPPSGGRAVSHYALRKPSIEDLKAEIDAWVRAQREESAKRPFPDRKERPAPAVGERPLSAKSAADDERPLFVGPPNGELPLSVNHGERPLSDRADGECVLPADGECVLPTVTSSKRTSRREGSGSRGTEGSGSLPEWRGAPAAASPAPAGAADASAVDEVDLAASAYNEMAERHGWTQCRALTRGRRNRLSERLKDIGGLESFKLALSAISNDDFLMGRKTPRPGERPFRLDIDRLMQTNGNMGDVLAKLVDAAGAKDVVQSIEVQVEAVLNGSQGAELIRKHGRDGARKWIKETLIAPVPSSSGGPHVN